ncbi:MAG: hypothetical protein IJ221_05875 [Oscillibacter sp.]|nr:hypothetical protein [Oscillibacter sp.]
MKRFFAWTLCLVLLASGCSRSAGEGQFAASPAPQEVSEPTPAAPTPETPEAPAVPDEPEDPPRSPVLPERHPAAWYDQNGDGVLQTLEFPVAESAIFGLAGTDAALYDAVAADRRAWFADIYAEDGEETMLALQSLTVYGDYETGDGAHHYVCRMGEQFWYDLGAGLGDLSAPVWSGVGSAGDTLHIVLDPEGNVVTLEGLWDGADNTRRIRDFCGPLTDLAQALNTPGADAGGRALIPAGDALLRAYLDAYFI